MNLRLKSYYIADDVEPNLYTNGDEYLIVESGMPYTGLYHKYTTGETFTLSKWNPKLSKKLINIQKNENDHPNVFMYKQIKNIKTKYNSIYSVPCKITNNDRNLGYVNRFFIKKINNTNIFEIDEKQFNDLQSEKIDPNLYFAVKIKWTISGVLKDTIKNGVNIESISTLNQKEINNKSKKMPGISNLLSNLTQYYSDTDITSPKDINNSAI